MLRKKPVHPKGDPTSNRNNSEMVCPIYLKINERIVHNSDAGHNKFPMVLINGSQVIVVRSCLTKKHNLSHFLNLARIRHEQDLAAGGFSVTNLGNLDRIRHCQDLVETS